MGKYILRPLLLAWPTSLPGVLPVGYSAPKLLNYVVSVIFCIQWWGKSIHYFTQARKCWYEKIVKFGTAETALKKDNQCMVSSGSNIQCNFSSKWEKPLWYAEKLRGVYSPLDPFGVYDYESKLLRSEELPIWKAFLIINQKVCLQSVHCPFN